MKVRYFIPLLGFLVPSLLIGFGVVIPGSCIAGVNDLTVGFASSLLGAESGSLQRARQDSNL